VRQGLHALLSCVPLLHDLLTAVNSCATARNAMRPPKKLLAMKFPPLRVISMG